MSADPKKRASCAFQMIENPNRPVPPQRQQTAEQIDVASRERLDSSRDELLAEVMRHREKMRDYATLLEARITKAATAHRGTASKLQEIWQTQLEALNARYRLHTRLIVGLLTLFAAIFALALFLVYRQAMIGQTGVSADVREIQRDLAQFFAGEAVAKQTLEKLDRLTAQLAVIASSLRRPQDGEQAIQASETSSGAGHEQSGVALSAEMRRLVAEQERLAGELVSLKSALQAVDAGGAGGAPAATDAGPSTAAVAPRGSIPAPPAGEDRAAATAGSALQLTKEDLHVVPAAAVGEVGAEGGGGSTHRESSAGAGAPGVGEMLVASEGDYALQLIGFSSRKSVDAFVGRRGLPDRVYYIRQTYRGRPWYALVHSLHKDKAAATEARSRLPADQIALDPWIRPLAAGTELRVVEVGRGRP
jgi:DamX protein